MQRRLKIDVAVEQGQQKSMSRQITMDSHENERKGNGKNKDSHENEKVKNRRVGMKKLSKVWFSLKKLKTINKNCKKSSITKKILPCHITIQGTKRINSEKT